jgi:hypothetical protein
MGFSVSTDFSRTGPRSVCRRRLAYRALLPLEGYYNNLRENPDTANRRVRAFQLLDIEVDDAIDIAENIDI